MFSMQKIRMRNFWLNLRWHIERKNNFMRVEDCNGIDYIMVGNKSYGSLIVKNDVEGAKLHIGNYCSIGEKVVFLLGLDHRLNTLSSFPFRNRILNCGYESKTKGDIIVDDDVWIGYGATVLSGVYIGQGAVVAAGAVVSHDVPPYAIVGGVPAKVIKYRFSPKVINYMLTLDYGKLEESMIREHIDELYKPIDELPLDKIKKLYSWFPKKG